MIATGTLIDERYELIELIGLGGYGSVYKARQVLLDRVVALKMLSTTLLHEGDGLARFEQEAKLINALKHKHIVGFYGYGVWQQAPYMVMEYVDGTPLQQLAVTGGMELGRVVRIMTQVFEALGCAHAMGVVHRDLKPANILVDANDNIKVIDFGLAKLMPGYGVPGQKLTETGYTIGTCHYMAPEQALGNGVDQRCDIYAAGCIMYQLLAGHVPFEGDDNVEIMYHHIQQEAKPLQDVLDKSALASALSAFVSNCMAKDPASRYQNCDDALTALRLISSENYSGVIPHMVPGVSAPKQRLRLPTRVVVAFAVSLLSATTAYFFMTSKLQFHPNGSAARYQSAIEHDQLSNFAEVKQIVQQDLRDHQLSGSERLDTLYQLLVLHPRKDRDEVERWIDLLLNERGDLVIVQPPPQDCRKYSDGNMARLLLGYKVHNYRHTIEQLIHVAKRQASGSPNGHYSLALVTFFGGSYSKACRIAESSLGLSASSSFKLAEYILEDRLKDAKEYVLYLRNNAQERALWLARIDYRAGDYPACLQHATEAYTYQLDPQNTGLAARYVLAAANRMSAKLPEEQKWHDASDALPAILPGYPIQGFDEEVWRYYTCHN